MTAERAKQGGGGGSFDHGVRVRMLVLAAVVAIGLARLAVRAAELQVGYAPTLQGMADEQRQREFLPPVWRGPILDRNGSELALTVNVDSIFANPSEVKDPAAAAASLGRILGLDPRTIEPRLGGDRRFVWIKRQVLPAQAELVAKLDLDGAETTKEPRRFYPGRSLAAQLVGFVGYDSVGLDGLEHEFDDVLRGESRSVRGVRDARGRMVFLEGLTGTQAPDRQKVVLAIDRTIQFIAEEELAAGMRAFEGVAGSVVVMDPWTGDVLAMANNPTFDPNLYAQADQATRRNRAVTDRFEPGSTMKIFTVAALLEAGLIRPDEQIYCEEGLWSIGDYVIRDSERNGWLTITQCLQRSSNICIAKLASIIGKRRLYDVLRRFGFGERTGVPLPGETSGLLRHPSRVFEVDLAAMSFGQGLSVSSLQMATALSAVANGGRLMRPVIVSSVIGADGEVVREFPSTVRRQVVDPRTARLVADMLTSVTEAGGTGAEAHVPGFNVSGKTGTAQKADPVRGGYYDDRWTASFVGFVPSDNPRIVVTVVVDEPLVNHYGGVVAAPIFRRIADRTLRYLGVAPERRGGTTSSQEVGGAAIPAAGALTVAGVPIALPGPDQIEVPDFSGETIRAALRIGRNLGLVVEPSGTGVGSEQWPRAGAGVAPGSVVRVRFGAGEEREP